MTIEFDHNGQLIRAYIIFDLKQIADAVLIIPFTHRHELGESIFLLRKENNWSSDALLQNEFPLTYSNLLTELDKNFNRFKLISEIYYQRYLS